MDQGEPGKDLPILEQTREADPHETESSKKMEAATEPTPDTLTATTEMVNAPFEVIAPVALQEQFSPFEDVSPLLCCQGNFLLCRSRLWFFI